MHCQCRQKYIIITLSAIISLKQQDKATHLQCLQTTVQKIKPQTTIEAPTECSTPLNFCFKTVWQSVRKAILSGTKYKPNTCTDSADKIKPQRKKHENLAYTVSLAAIFRMASSAHTKCRQNQTTLMCRQCIDIVSGSETHKRQLITQKTLNHTHAHNTDTSEPHSCICRAQNSKNLTSAVSLCHSRQVNAGKKISHIYTYRCCGQNSKAYSSHCHCVSDMNKSQHSKTKNKITDMHRQCRQN